MKYKKHEAKEYARAHMKGLYAAIMSPLKADLSFDEAGLRRNFRHWVDALGIDGFFVSGKQAEFFSMTPAERKRSLEIGVDECRGRAATVMSCSDQNLDVLLDLARHAEGAGADYIVVHSPVLHFGAHTDDTIHEYYRHIAEQVNIGIALWNHPDCGYVMSPELCARIAEIPNVVAIKYSVERALYAKLTRLAGDKIVVSTASEEEWLDNVVELGWRLYFCSNPPFLYQTEGDRRLKDYTDLAFKGETTKARALRDSLEPVRKAFRGSRPAGKPQAHAKYWQELLGQAGGPVRRPLLQLTEAEKASIRQAFAASGLKPPPRRAAAE
jgi:4-hydroxy-tetrahydrodipicolinate synthase